MHLTTMVDSMIKWRPNNQRTIAANSKLAELNASSFVGQHTAEAIKNEINMQNAYGMGVKR